MIHVTQSENTDSVVTCSWCGKRFPPQGTEQPGQTICEKCVRLLRLAGVSDDEIFSGQPQEDDKPDPPNGSSN